VRTVRCLRVCEVEDRHLEQDAVEPAAPVAAEFAARRRFRCLVDPAELEAAFRRRDEVADAVRSAGYAYVALDLDGFRSGSLNEVLARSTLDASGERRV